MEYKTGHLKIEGYNLSYRIEGNGPDALVIGSALYYSRSFSQKLRQHLRLIFIDWRGFSKSDTSTKIALSTLLDDIETIRKKLEIKTSIVIGHSAHALLALEYAKKYPSAISHVVMIAISPHLHPSMALLADKAWAEVASPERKKALEKRIEKLPNEALDKLSPSDRFVAWYIRKDSQAWYDYNFDSSWLWEGVHPNMPLFDDLYGTILRDLDITEGLGNFDKPVFLALGRYDFIIAPPTAWDPIKGKFRDLTIQVFEKSGHSPQYEERDLFDKSLLEWLMNHPEKKTKKIEVTPYNPKWPALFTAEAVKIKEALGPNCIALHHVGSTSIPGLLAKPIIDIIGVVKDTEEAIEPLKSLGFQYKGEYNIPMRRYFSREGVNLHFYQEGHPEIELNLLFRDYLREHPDARDEYATLKQNLLKDKSSYEKTSSTFTGYNLGKDAFIRKILKKAHFNRLRIMKCSHYIEWDAVKRLRNKYLPLEDSYSWTFTHKDHAHLIFYKGVEILGYAHIQFSPDQQAAVRVLVIDEPYRHQGLGSQFLQLCEEWLKAQGIQSVYMEVQPDLYE